MDQTQILEGLYNDLLSNEKFVNVKFKFLVNWGVLNEQLQITTLSYFEDINGDILTISLAVLSADQYLLPVWMLTVVCAVDIRFHGRAVSTV